MKWFLVFYAFSGQGGDSGIIPGYRAASQMIQIEMPSQEVCEQVQKLNRFTNTECWAKPATK